MGNKITNASAATSTNLTADETGLVPIPFYAPPNSLPEELPSWEEIEAAASGETLLSDKRTRKIVRVREVYCEIRCSGRLSGRADAPLLAAQQKSIAVLEDPARVCHVSQC